MIRTIHIPASEEYDVLIGSGLLAEAGERIRGISKAASAVIVSDDTVDNLYGSRVETALSDAGFRTARFVFPHGEAHKTVST